MCGLSMGSVGGGGLTDKGKVTVLLLIGDN